MTNSKQAVGIRRLLLLATNPKAISWPVLLTGTTLSVVLHFAPSGNTVHGNFWVRLIIAVLGYLPSIGFVALIQRVIRGIKSQNLKIAFVLASYLLGGALRGIFFSLVFFYLGMSGSLNLVFRVFGSALPFGFATAVATISVGALSESRLRIKFFLEKQDELRSALQEVARARSSFENRVSSEIENRVEAEIKQLSGKPEQAMLIELKALVGDFVRPLSHSLASAVPNWQPLKVLETKVGWRTTLQKLNPAMALRPILLTTMSAVTAAPAFFTFFGWQRALVMEVISIATLYSLTSALNPLLRKLPNSLPLIVRALFTTGSLLVVAMPAGLLSDWYSNDPVNTHFVFESSLTVVPTLGWILLLGGAANASSRDLEANLAETISKLRWLRARINLVNWFEHGELSRLLHGEIQSALHFGILKFEANPGNHGGAIEEMQRRIHEAFTRERQPLDFEQQLIDLSDFWKDICLISWEVDQNATDLIADDEIGKSALLDIISESCGNAIRHGQAKNIWITVQNNDPEVIGLSVANDGTPPKPGNKVGLGTSILDACTLEWSLKSTDRVVLEAEVPVKR
jgi:hypothetical protein